MRKIMCTFALSVVSMSPFLWVAFLSIQGRYKYDWIWLIFIVLTNFFIVVYSALWDRLFTRKKEEIHGM